MPITESSIFDYALMSSYDGVFEAITLYLKSDADQEVANGRTPQAVGTIRVTGHLQAISDYFEASDPEFRVVAKRVAEGNCEIGYGYHYPGLSHSQLAHAHWEIVAKNPLEPSHLVFQNLALSGRYSSETGRSLPRFKFPGIVEGATQTYYKRGDGEAAPDVRAVSDLAAAGWSLIPPYGPHHLHSIQVTDTPAGAPIIEAPRRAHLRRPDEAAAVRKLARAWHEYWTGLTGAEQGINVRMTLRSHVEHAIGRIWDARPLDDDVRYYKVGANSTSTRAARDAEDWYLGNLEQWAYDWGFPAAAVALAGPGKRSVLADLLDDYVFCHLQQNGDPGEQLRNPSEGVTAAQWTAWGTTHYNAALGTVVKATAGADAVVQSGGNYAMQGAATVVNPVGPTVYAWEKVSGPDGGSLDATNVAQPSFTAPTLTAGADPAVYVYRLTVTNNGETATDEVTLRAASPVSLPALVSVSAAPGVTKTYQLTATGGVEPYAFAKTSGSAWITMDTMGLVTIAPSAGETAGVTHNVNYTVTDASGAVVSGAFNVILNAA